MTSICFYFQVHQPFRIKNYNFFNIGVDDNYEFEEQNKSILDKVAAKCYLRTNEVLYQLIKKHNGKFKISFSISGVALEQFEKYRPDVLESFKKLVATGCVELLSETYYHSLSFIYSKDEFERQVLLHRASIKRIFGVTPSIFRNTELIYNNELSYYAHQLGFKGIITEGVDRHLGSRSPNFLYSSPSAPIKVFLKNYKLSDDIAFRFSNKDWEEHPLSSHKFAHWVHSMAGHAEILNLFMDYETFGEHQWEESGIFNFLEHLPDAIFTHPDFNFITPSEAANTLEVRETYDIHHFISWADSERDLSAWISNDLQEEALSRIYSFEGEVMASDNKDLIHTWRKLQTSDHFYYMCTKFWNDGDVHKYFSPFDSPFQAFSNYMNVLTDFEHRFNLVPNNN